MKSQFDSLTFAMPADDDDDDFQSPTQSLPLTQPTRHNPSKKHSSSQPPLRPSNSTLRPSKKPRRSLKTPPGKENAAPPLHPLPTQKVASNSSHSSQSRDSRKWVGSDEDYNLSLVASSLDPKKESRSDEDSNLGLVASSFDWKKEIRSDEDYNLGSVASSLDSKKESRPDEDCNLSLVASSLDCSFRDCDQLSNENENVSGNGDSVCFDEGSDKKGLKLREGYLCNSIEAKLLNSRVGCDFSIGDGDFGEDTFDHFEPGTQLDVLLKLCSEEQQEGSGLEGDGSVCCPLCGIDISGLSEELRQVHTNDCLDKGDTLNVVLPSGDPGDGFPQQIDSSPARSPQKAVDVSPVLDWLHSLGLAKYEEAFVREEIDWDTLQWLTEEDLFSIGVTALGPRKKIVHALNELRKGSTHAAEIQEDMHAISDLGKQITNEGGIHTDASKVLVDKTSKLAANMLITDFFPGSVTDQNKGSTTSRGQQQLQQLNNASIPTTSRGQHVAEKGQSDSRQKRFVVKNHAMKGKVKDVPLWCCIPGTPFRVDAFRYLRRDCSHWFLTHFHLDHYQGLTRSFCHGKIYCSSITARLVNMKIGIPSDRLQVLPLNQKISIAGIEVTCLDANHCPGSIIILFEPPNGKAVLHTGDFRFSEEIASMSVLQTCPIHTLILDTTYCNPQYDFPKQEAVIQFVIEAIQAEAFNPKTLFLIGSYTIGKERLFLEVARVLRKKVYVTVAKLRLLKCLGFSEEDMQWFTLNEWESHIHVVPMWTLASFKRLKHISNQYASRFNLIVAFSPTGWTFGKGKKKSPGRRWQQGTLIRYEVPYSEHCSFTELREFVKFLSPVNIIPSVNNDGLESANNMVSLLLS
ncbi:hypothetical protein L1049_017833 [Liquidambar formosana]|uniref:SAM domain-containing protein n=1 Tax=Liquidambar formosana TaxID=63359 RepID=A0AAP0NJD2_LIQFO